MKQNHFLSILFILSVCMGILGAYCKVMHWHAAESILITALGIWIVFILISLMEIISSTRIEKSEKIMWSFGMVMMSGIVGVIYMLVGRKRIAD